MYVCTYVYIHMYVYMCILCSYTYIYIYIYMFREIERERERSYLCWSNLFIEQLLCLCCLSGELVSTVSILYSCTGHGTAQPRTTHGRTMRGSAYNARPTDSSDESVQYCRTKHDRAQGLRLARTNPEPAPKCVHSTI